MWCPACHERNCCHTRPRMIFIDKQSQGRRDRRLRTENARLQTRSAIVDAINALREEEGQGVSIPNANPDWGGPAQVITVYADFTDDKVFSSDPGIDGMDESLLNCLQKASKARAAAQAAKAQFQNQGGKP